MNKEGSLERLTKLQAELDKTLSEGRNSFAYTITRPKIIRTLGVAVAEARRMEVTDEDIDELVAELEITTGRRPVELEYFWNPERLSKGWRNN